MTGGASLLDRPLRIRDRQIPALDGVRGIALVSVLLHHFTVGHAPPRTAAERCFYWLSDAGWIGLDVFFALSGFLITSLLLEAPKGPGYFWKFYARRFLRITPLYYLALFFFLTYLPSIGVGEPVAAADQFWSFAYLVNMKAAFGGWFPGRGTQHFWSLSVEEQFYLVWPFVVHAGTRRGLVITCVVLCAFAATLRGEASAEGWLGTWQIFMMTPTRMDLLAAGALLAALGHGERGLSDSFWWICPAGMLGVAYVVANTIYFDGSFRWDAPQGWPVAIHGTAVAALSVGLLVLALGAPRRSLAGRVLAHRWTTALGHYSYGTYVWHIFVDDVYGVYAPLLGLPGREPAMLPAMLLSVALRCAASIALGIVSFHVFEKWFLRLQPRTTPHGRTPAPSPALAA